MYHRYRPLHHPLRQDRAHCIVLAPKQIPSTRFIPRYLTSDALHSSRRNGTTRDEVSNLQYRQTRSIRYTSSGSQSRPCS
ncbi:hypothetical protein L210DRAFT_2477595 [Boletus edulis BED1]|uniref:Uncharacterized protein n=1 Tax=Boletus edulis BED1 TaxID=1328754 RepID=A0AAD4BP63_BOLED|nr:hypothetical protein L210DRAFT_2477595 [Boletus edulis BED1]